jgi:hypothetical protein
LNVYLLWIWEKHELSTECVIISFCSYFLVYLVMFVIFMCSL